MKPSFGRRQFLKLLGLSGLSALLGACGLERLVETLPAPSPAPLPSALATGAVTPTATPAFRSYSAIARAASYDKALLRGQMQAMFEDLGGIRDILPPGARVAIKPNLTGGTWWDASLPVPATELFEVHPVVVQALAELLLDAGAGQIYIMDGLGDPAIFPTWGYTDIAAYLNAQLVDLCSPAPYAGFANFPVGPNWQCYDSFALNGLLGEVDTFISVAKMKCHSTTGVTLALKNLFGIAPISQYRRSAGDNNRSAFHESTSYDRRVPRVIVDLNLTRPVQLAVVDGVMTAEGGAGPWDTGYGPVRPGLLLAGKDAVAVDAVASAVMGFDPEALSGSSPFDYADNHLALACQAGLGTNRLSEIGVSGLQITEAAFPFRKVR